MPMAYWVSPVEGHVHLHEPTILKDMTQIIMDVTQVEFIDLFDFLEGV